MSRLLDAMMTGAVIQLSYSQTAGISAHALWKEGKKEERVTGGGQADVDAALSGLEDALSEPGNRGALAQRLRRKKK